MFRRHLNFSSYLHGKTASLRYIACVSSSRKWCTQWSSASSVDVGWDRTLPFPLRSEKYCSTTSSAESLSPSLVPTALCSSRRWYVYQPPGTREPNMPWFRSGASSSSATALSRHNSPGSKSSPSKPGPPPASSKPIPPPSSSPQATKDSVTMSGDGSLRHATSNTRVESSSVPPSVGNASLISSGASSASMKTPPSRGGAGEVFSSLGRGTPRPSPSSTSALPVSSISSLWGTGASLSPAPPPQSTSTSHTPYPSSSPPSREAAVMGGGTAPHVPPSSPPISLLPASPVVPLWTGPLELRTPLEYILQRHDKEHGERSDSRESEERSGAKRSSFDPHDSQGIKSAAADTMLHDLAALLIDPVAQNTVERISLRMFASMQPKRQLLALQGNKEWWEWIVASAPYREVVESVRNPLHTAAAETTLKQDRRILKEAGLMTLQDWVEHQHLVTMSPQTKSALDAAVTITVQEHVAQVLSVVKQCHSVRHLLRRWLSDVVGKFILDSLALSVDAAAVSVQKARGARWSTRKGLFAPPSTAEKADIADYDAVEEEDAMNEEEMAMATLMMKGTGGIRSSSSSSSNSSAVGGAAKKHPKKPIDKRSDTSHQTASPLRAGEVCTVEHYLMFLQKVTASVRQDRWKHENSSRSAVANRHAGREGTLGKHAVDATTAVESSEDECEVQERTKAIVASAFSHLLQHAMQLYLPAELRELGDGGYLALERVPVLLQRAASQLQLRTLPVGYFILHSTTQEKSSSPSLSSSHRRGGRAADGGQGEDNAFFSPGVPLFPEGGEEVITDVVHPLTDGAPSVGTHDFAREENGESTLPGAFLTDEEDPSIPLMIWKRPRRALHSGRGGGNGKPLACRTPGTPFLSTHSHGSGRATLYDGESLQESYYSMLFHLQSALEKLSFTTIEELFDDADSLSGCPQSTVWNAFATDKSAASSPLAWSSTTSSSGGVCCSSSLLSAIFGEDPLFGPAKLVEDQLTTAVSMPPSASTVEKPPLYFVEAGANCGKTALLERLQQRLRPQEVIRSTPSGSGTSGGGRTLLSSVSHSTSPSRGGAVLIRYQSATTPFIPDLDDHPMAFAARFWFRVVLSTMPYFTRHELLYRRAPTSSPLWWSNQPHQLHWSYQTIAQSGAIPSNSIPSSILVDDIHHVLDSMESKWGRVLFNARGEPVPAERVRKAFDVAVQMEEEEEEERQRRERSQLEGSTERKWTETRGKGASGEALPSHSEEDVSAQQRQAQRRREQQYQELTRLLSSQSLLEIPLTPGTAGQDGRSEGHSFLGHSSLSAGAGSWPVAGDGASGAEGNGGGTRGRMSATLFAASRRQQAAEALQRRTGHSMGEMLSTCMLHITAGMSDTHLVFAGQRVSPLLLAYGGGNRVVRQFHLPVLRPGSMNWQQRVRVLPPLAVLQALHRRAGLEMPGILYEVIKNSPAFIGSTLELLWSATGSRHSSTGAPGSPSAHRSYLTLESSTSSSSSNCSSNSSSSSSSSPHGSNALRLTSAATTGEGAGAVERRVAGVEATSSSSSYLLQRLLLKPYDAQSLFLELPLRNRLLCHPQHACHRLVKLLQLQLCSPNGYLTTLVDTTLEDAEMGLVMPHSHTFSQVHPFALFIVFSHHAALQPSLSPPTTTPLKLSKKNALQAHRQMTAEAADKEVDDAADPAAVTPGENSSMEQQVIHAWTEVWAEYKETVQCMGTTPRRKKEALRVLLHGALLLRAAALSGTDMNLNCAVPPYGFPLLASDIRVRPGKQLPSPTTASLGGRRRHPPKDPAWEVCPASPDTVRRATAAYTQFFAHALPSHRHFAFRPVVGLNAGCDVVLFSGHTLYLYDIAISSYHLGQVIQRRFAEALLGILHLFEKQILSRDRIHQVQYVTVVCCDQEEEPGYYRYGGDVDGIMGNNGSTASEGRHHGGRPLLSRSYQSLFTSSSYVSSGGNRGWEAQEGELSFPTPLSGEDTASSSFTLQRPDNVGAAVPLILDYSALLDDDTMDLLQYLRREVLQLGVRKEEKKRGESSSMGATDEEGVVPTTPPCTEEVFRTVQDLLDALEQQFRLPVRQRVLSTFEELEGLFSPTLLQLIPDSMLLPPFTPAVVSSEDLLQEVFQQQQEEEHTVESDVGGGALFLNAPTSSSSTTTTSSLTRPTGAEWEDLEQDHFLAQEQVALGHPSSSSPDNPFLADQELLESTELLEAMMNDGEEEWEGEEGMPYPHGEGKAEEGEVDHHRRREESVPTQAATAPPSSSSEEAAVAGQRMSGAPPIGPASTPPTGVDHSFSWLQHAIPRAPSAVGSSPAFPFGGEAETRSAAPAALHAPSNAFSPPPPAVGSLPFPYRAASPMGSDGQVAQEVLYTGGYNAAALPSADPREEMDRERGGRREDGVGHGGEQPPPAARDPTASLLAQEGQDDGDWEEEEDTDEEVEEGEEGGEEEGDHRSHEKKSKTAGPAGRGKKGRTRASLVGRPRAVLQGTRDEETELHTLLRKSESGAVLSTGERRRLRRLRRRRLAVAASGGKEQKLTVSTALRLRQQQKKGTGEKKSGVSSITGLSYDEEARFLERFLADERRRRQQQNRRRAPQPFSVEASPSTKKKTSLKKMRSKLGAKKPVSSGSSSSSSKSRKKVIRSSKPFPPRRPVRQPKRLKRA